MLNRFFRKQIFIFLLFPLKIFQILFIILYITHIRLIPLLYTSTIPFISYFLHLFSFRTSETRTVRNKKRFHASDSCVSE